MALASSFLSNRKEHNGLNESSPNKRTKLTSVEEEEEEEEDDVDEDDTELISLCLCSTDAVSTGK